MAINREKLICRKQNNQCPFYNNNIVFGKSACKLCLDKKSSESITMKNRYVKDGKCYRCGKNQPENNSKRNNWYNGSTTEEKDKISRKVNKEKVFKHYGGKCVCCGEDESNFLAIDHIQGRGNTHRKKINKYGSTFFKWLVDNNFPIDFHILCHNCNVGKFLNGGVCPHETNEKYFSDDLDDYKSVPPISTRTVKVRYIYKGNADPIRYDYEEDR